MLVQILDKYEENQEEDARRIVKKICNIIILLSNDGTYGTYIIFSVWIKLST